MAEFPRMRDRVKDPATRTGAHIVGPDVAGHRRRGSFAHAHPHDDKVTVECAWRGDGEISLLQRGPLVAQVVEQIDTAFVAEAFDLLAGLRIDRI